MPPARVVARIDLQQTLARADGAFARPCQIAACDVLKGTYTQEGDQITVHFEDPESCNGWDDMKLKQVSDCSMAAYWWKDPTTGEIKEDDSWMFERTEPRCPHR